MDAKFGADANFKGSRFSMDANFGRVSFSGDARFIYSEFRNNSDFSNSKFDKFANFRGSRFQVPSILSLKEIDFEQIYLDWISIKNLDRHFDSKVYLSLIESYKIRGFFEDADNCYYQFRNESRQSLKDLYKICDWIIMALYGYGVKPLRPLLGFVLLLSFFTILYLLVGVAGNSTWDAFNTSLIVALSGTKLIENPNHSPTVILYWAFTIEKLLGSLFFALFLISISRTIIR